MDVRRGFKVVVLVAGSACNASHGGSADSAPALEAPARDAPAIDAENDAGCAVPGRLVTYEMATTTDTSDTRCDPGQTGSCTIQLRGFLFFPQGRTGALPAIVWNHGSEQLPGPKCAIAEYFVPQGYVVFVPHRRGQGESTGVYIGNYTAGSQISYLEDQVDDVTTAWTWVQTQSQDGASIDATRMAIAGHSYGGIETLLTNATTLAQRVALDLCGDSESWGQPDNDSIVAALTTAVGSARSPIFFAQPQNDVATEPTVQFSFLAGSANQQYQAAIYPPVADATTGEEAHVDFVTEPAEVAQWGAGALDFMHRYGM